jgi:hypothetical protein
VDFQKLMKKHVRKGMFQNEYELSLNGLTEYQAGEIREYLRTRDYERGPGGQPLIITEKGRPLNE